MRSLCYNSLFQQLTYNGKQLRGRVLNRVSALLAAAICTLALVSCGGNNNNQYTLSNGNTITDPKNSIKNRAFISNQYSGNLQIVDSANDTTAFFSSSNTYQHHQPDCRFIGEYSGWHLYDVYGAQPQRDHDCGLRSVVC